MNSNRQVTAKTQRNTTESVLLAQILKLFHTPVRYYDWFSFTLPKKSGNTQLDIVSQIMSLPAII